MNKINRILLIFCIFAIGIVGFGHPMTRELSTSPFPINKVGVIKKLNVMVKRKTNEEFIVQANITHGGKYLYDKTNYINKRTKVCITCPTHGDFWQKPSNHLQGSGCPECAKKSISIKNTGAKLSLDEFIRKAKTVHGEKFDYSYIKEYKGVTCKIKLKCNNCGNIFETTANVHLSGSDCPECSRLRRAVSQDYFIKRLKEKWGNEYDYSKVHYINKKTPVTIVCNKHGAFKRTPSNIFHNKGGCPKCEKEKMKIDSHDNFLRKAKEIHGSIYDYSNVEYIDSSTKVLIICHKHGSFMQTPNEHLDGCGCPKCGYERNAKKFRMTKNEFVLKANSVHGDNRYDYTNSNYVNSITYIKIKCNKCGNTFFQIPSSHLRGHGCPHCRRSLGEERVAKFLNDGNIVFLPQYFIKSDDIFSPVKKFKVDFFLPNHNTIIEFNGGQHYKPIEWFGGKEHFAIQQQRDITLRVYCNRNNINLIEIPYWDFENIEKIIKTQLKL